MEKLITASIVLYKTNALELTKAVKNVLNTNQNLRLYLIDNSPTSKLNSFEVISPNIEYNHNPSNPGFGAGHNLAIKKAIALGSRYHFIINPDIYFDMDVISPMVNYMRVNENVGMMMPEILYPDGSIQYLPKLLPNLFWILKRKFKKMYGVQNRFISKYELRNFPRNEIYNAPILSGCFTLLNLKAIKEVGAYDDSYFMYFEDFDLSRRIHKKYKTIYFPHVSIFHGYQGGANKSLKLFIIFLKSMFIYFNKWGWFFDIERKRMNKNALNQFLKLYEK